MLLLSFVLAEATRLEITTTRSANCSKQITRGDEISVNYKGFTLISRGDGDPFTSSTEPFTFTLGAKHILKGWNLGLEGACQGESRRIVVPKHLGWGDADFIFDFDVLQVKYANNDQDVDGGSEEL